MAPALAGENSGAAGAASSGLTAETTRGAQEQIRDEHKRQAEADRPHPIDRSDPNLDLRWNAARVSAEPIIICAVTLLVPIEMVLRDVLNLAGVCVAVCASGLSACKTAVAVSAAVFCARARRCVRTFAVIDNA